MNQLRLYTSLFTSLNNLKGLPYWVLSFLRKPLRIFANKNLPKYLSKPVPYSRDVAENVIVSLTSYPGRIGIVWQVVETLKRQSIRPQKIMLWLSRDQFASDDIVPKKLQSLQDDVFEIRMVKGDIRSYKKYYYVMQEFPDATIITFDDDIYYHPDTIKHLVRTNELFQHCIVANVTNQLQYDGNELKPYKEWGRHYKKYSSKNRVQIGVGGVLYPPHSLNALVFREDLFTSLAPMADDLWLNCMSRLNMTPVIQSDFHYLWLEINTKVPSLTSVNNGNESMNDRQLSQIREYLINHGFKDVYSFDYIIDNE